MGIKKAIHKDYYNLAKKLKDNKINKEFSTPETITKDNTNISSKHFRIKEIIEGPEDLHYFNVSVVMNNRKIGEKFDLES